MNVWQQQLRQEERRSKYWEDQYNLAHDLAQRTADERDAARQERDNLGASLRECSRYRGIAERDAYLAETTLAKINRTWWKRPADPGHYILMLITLILIIAVVLK